MATLSERLKGFVHERPNGCTYTGLIGAVIAAADRAEEWVMLCGAARGGTLGPMITDEDRAHVEARAAEAQRRAEMVLAGARRRIRRHEAMLAAALAEAQARFPDRANAERVRAFDKWASFIGGLPVAYTA